jgi:hypothetical protein
MLATKDEYKPHLKEMEENLIDIQAWVLEELNNAQRVCKGGRGEGEMKGEEGRGRERKGEEGR